MARADPDHLAGLVAECAPENSCLIFCSSRKNCENVALLLSRILPKLVFLQLEVQSLFYLNFVSDQNFVNIEKVKKLT